ncbi:MAG: hypothetical protein QOI18_698 [Solirubrobacteraceae bacterium]|nr:hypothetical protein [Solirubrobacteraceae bacterium]
MAKTWVLDTETKGTGAHMAPLERADEKASEDRGLSTVTFRRPLARASTPAPAAPQRFKVVDVLSGRVLAQDVAAREAVDALEQLRSVLDARVSVWSTQTRRWKLLSLDEQKALWRYRRDPAAEAAREP